MSAFEYLRTLAAARFYNKNAEKIQRTFRTHQHRRLTAAKQVQRAWRSRSHKQSPVECPTERFSVFAGFMKHFW